MVFVLILGSSWAHFGDIFGVVLGSFWGCFGGRFFGKAVIFYPASWAPLPSFSWISRETSGAAGTSGIRRRGPGQAEDGGGDFVSKVRVPRESSLKKWKKHCTGASQSQELTRVSRKEYHHLRSSLRSPFESL